MNMGESINSEAKSSFIVPRTGQNGRLVFIVISGLIAFIFYFLTAFRTITWWDNGEYSLSALTLGIPHPPGSLLATVLGWLVTRLPLGISKIFLLNLFAGLLASLTLCLITYISFRLYQRSSKPGDAFGEKNHTIIYAIAALSGLSLGLGETLWLYAVKFTPYVLTALFTAMVLWAMFRWWENSKDSSQIKWLFIIGLLIGLDFSVHRTNFLLIPGLLIWILLANARILTSLKSWGIGLAGFVLGMSFHLLTILLAMRKPFMNINDPSGFSRFWDYVSLKQYGGGMLINIFPRKGDFWHFQIPDFRNVFTANFFSTHEGLGILGLVPFILGIIGLIVLIKRQFRLGIAMLALFIISSAGAIIYFNVPENFFRSMDRHYLPALVIFTVWIVLGAAFTIRTLLNFKGTIRAAVLILAVILISIIPINQAMRNYRTVDGSKSFFAYDVSQNLLNTVAPDGILIVGGDNETWPLWYLQMVEKIRPDVKVINFNLMNTPWYLNQLLATYPDFPLSLPPADSEWNVVRPWKDTIITILGDKNNAKYDLSDDIILPDSIQFEIKPNISSKYLLSADWLLLQMIEQNKWRVPLYFSTSLDQSIITWARPYMRQEGIARRLVPIKNPSPDLALLQNNLFERYKFRGFTDYSIPLEKSSVWAGQNYLSAFSTLFTEQGKIGNMEDFKKTVSGMRERIAIDRLELPGEVIKQLESLYK